MTWARFILSASRAARAGAGRRGRRAAGRRRHLASGLRPTQQCRSAVGSSADTPVAGTRVLAGGRDSYADIVKVVAPAVVTIRIEGRARVSPTGFSGQDDDLLRRFFGEQFGQAVRSAAPAHAPRQQRGLGSGVIVSDDGYILTNNHVIDGADDIVVELTDGRTLQGQAGRLRPAERSGAAEDRGDQPADRSRSATPTRCRSATWCSRSAIRSASARR